jgi:hypothetical protein
MTVTSTDRATDWLATDGVNKNWPFNFTLFDTSMIVVQVADVADEDDISLVEYTSDIGLIPANAAFSAGYVVYPVSAAAVATAKFVRIVRRTPVIQTTQIGREGDFSPEIHERAFDRLTLIAQEHAEVLATLPSEDLMQDAIDAAANSDWVNAPAIVHGKRGVMMKDKNGAIVEGAGVFVSAYEWGARAGAGDNTAFIEDALGEIRTAGGGRLHLGPGRWLADDVDYDYLAGGLAKLVISGEGWNTRLEKRVDDDAAFVKIGRDDTTLTYQGGLVTKDLHIKGFSGGDEAVFTLNALTIFSLENVRITGGERACHLVNCVTGNIYNSCFTDSKSGLRTTSFVFPDTTFSAVNVINIYGGALKDNSLWGLVFAGGSGLNIYGTQIENNGTVATPSGGIYQAPTVGDLGVNIKAPGVSMFGGWVENNKGTAGVVVDGGHFSAKNVLFVANASANKDLEVDGGTFALDGCKMPNSKAGGNILVSAGASAGSVVSDCEIHSISGIDVSKVEIRNVKDNAGTIYNLRKGLAGVRAGATDEKMLQTGLETGEAGSGTVVFATAFSAAPRVVASPAGNDPTKLKTVQVHNISTTGFSYNIKEITSGSATVNNTASGDAFTWFALGNAP